MLDFVDTFIDKDDLLFNHSYVLRNMLIGFFAGSIVAIGGAVKDAPAEGFKPATFIRSPIVGAVACTVLGALIPNAHWFLLFLSVIGFERIIIELYKLFRGKRPGKFENGEWGEPKEQIQSNPPHLELEEQISPLPHTPSMHMERHRFHGYESPDFL